MLKIDLFLLVYINSPSIFIYIDQWYWNEDNSAMRVVSVILKQNKSKMIKTGSNWYILWFFFHKNIDSVRTEYIRIINLLRCQNYRQFSYLHFGGSKGVVSLAGVIRFFFLFSPKNCIRLQYSFTDPERCKPLYFKNRKNVMIKTRQKHEKERKKRKFHISKG